MLLHFKCHWTIALATLIPILSLNICISSSEYDQKPTANSINFNENAQTSEAGPLVETEEHNYKDKRKWSKFASWRKRNWENNKENLGEKRWMHFLRWRKHSAEIDADNIAQFTPEMRNWYPIVPSGERAAGIHQNSTDYSSERTSGVATGNLHVAQRAWSRFPSWGKRKIEEGLAKGKLSQLPARSKRCEGFNDMSYTDCDEIDTEESTGTPNNKRNWSKFVSWGKRAFGESDNLGRVVADKRKWSPFATWGKRNEDAIDQWNLEKGRRYQNSILGQRDLVTQIMNKMAWPKFVSSVKRSIGLNAWNMGSWWPDAIRNRQSDGSATSNNQAKFDINHDDTIDLHELLAYLQTLQTHIEALMTYMSKQDSAER